MLEIKPDGRLHWSCLGCGLEGSALVKVRVVGSYTPTEWNYFHEMSTAEHEKIGATQGIKCQQPITWTVKPV